MLKEFKEFAMKGNVVDLAIGVIIGGAFGKIVTSFVNDVIMPLLGLLIGGVDFSSRFISLKNTDGIKYATFAEANADNIPTLNYGLFLGTVLDFLIIAFTIFIVIKQLNRFKKKEIPVVVEPTTKECVFCKTEISKEATRCPHCTSVLE